MQIDERRPAAVSRSVPKVRGRRGWIIAALQLALAACGSDDPLADPVAPTSAGALSLVIVSGDNQPGRAGHELRAPLVARVADEQGRGVKGVTVIWSVASGEGTFDLQFDTVGCPPLGTARVDTDTGGIARVSFMPTWFGPVTVSATVPDARGSPATFATDASDPGATLTIAEGDHQQGRSDEALPTPLRVKLTDGNGDPVPNVSVSWSTRSVRGSLLDGCPWTSSWDLASTTARTLPDDAFAGLSSLRFRPREFEVGTTTVSAAVSGVAGSPATFTVDITTMAIALAQDWFMRETRFRGPYVGPWFFAPVGATVEFRNDVSAARIRSTSTPPGGEAFDSGQLGQGERFAFVPRVAGTWQFVDEVSGATGELTVQGG